MVVLSIILEMLSTSQSFQMSRPHPDQDCHRPHIIQRAILAEYYAERRLQQKVYNSPNGLTSTGECSIVAGGFITRTNSSWSVKLMNCYQKKKHLEHMRWGTHTVCMCYFEGKQNLKYKKTQKPSFKPVGYPHIAPDSLRRYLQVPPPCQGALNLCLLTAP